MTHGEDAPWAPPAFWEVSFSLLWEHRLLNWKTLTSAGVGLDLKDSLLRGEKQLCKYINELSNGWALCSPSY